MGIRKGTKLTDSPKTHTLKFRYDDETKRQLESLAKEQNKSKSEIIRNGIAIQYEGKNK